MANLVLAMNVSLDGYVDHDKFAPGPELFRHWIKAVRYSAGCLYGRLTYELMRYWDTDDPGWSPDERAFASVWRRKPKWVVSRTLASVGPNATLVATDIETAIRRLKAGHGGEIAVAGPALARSLGEFGLMDEYRLYVHPVVLGEGKPFFAGPLPRLRLVGSDRPGEDVIRLTYSPDSGRPPPAWVMVKSEKELRNDLMKGDGWKAPTGARSSRQTAGREQEGGA